MGLLGAVVVVLLASSDGPPTCERSRCGPAPGYPTGTCEDGVHQFGRGGCTERNDGSCGWLHLVCPDPAAERCSAQECGAPPASSSWACPRSTERGEFGPCIRSKGRCGWVHRPCASAPRPAPPPPAPATRAPTWHACDPLPAEGVLETWEVRSICSPGGGPMPPPRKVLRQLDDGTRIIQERQGCYRARYRRCYSK